jgi:hypothetical protein
MTEVPVNYLAVVVAAVVNMVLGFLWYGPVFGKQWMALSGFSQADKEKAKAKGMNKEYTLMTVGSLVMAYVLSHSLVFASTYTETAGVAAGVMVGFWSWLGFVAPVTISSVLWDGKPWKLWFLNAGYYLVGLVVMGVILALWQ